MSCTIFFHPREFLSIKNACKIARNEWTKDKLTVRDFTYLFFDKLQWKNKVWRIIWKSKLKIPPEVQVFFWWVCCDILLARIHLDQIRVNIRYWCYFSDTYGEIVLLLFLECTTTRLDLGSLMDHILDGLPRSSSFLSQMEELVQKLPQNQLEFMVIVWHLVWSDQNKIWRGTKLWHS